MAFLSRRRSPLTLAVLLLCLLGCAVAQEAVPQETVVAQEETQEAAPSKETEETAVCDCTTQCEAMIAAKTAELETATHKAAELGLTLEKLRDDLSFVEKQLTEKDASLAEERRRADDAEEKANALKEDADKAADKALADAKEAHERALADVGEAGAKALAEAEEAHKEAVAKAAAELDESAAKALKKAEQAHNDALAKAVSDLEEKLEESVAKQNEALEVATNLQDSLEKIESGKKRETDALNKKVDSLTDSLDTVKADLKTTNDKYYGTRKELIDVQADLRDAHTKLVSKYVNTTLLVEDAYWLAETASVKSRSVAGDGWKAVGDGCAALVEGYHWTVKTVTPMVHESITLLEPHVRKVGDAYEKSPVAPHVRSATKSASDAYDAHVRPTVEGTVVPFVEENLVPLWGKAVDAAEKAGVAVVSALQDTSRAVISRLDNGESKEEPSAVRKAAVDAFGWIDENAEQIVEVTAVYGGLFLFLYFFGGFMIRAVLFIVLLPFLPLRLLFGGKKEKKNGREGGDKVGAVQDATKGRGQNGAHRGQNGKNRGQNGKKHKAR